MPGKPPGDGAFKFPRGRETSAYRSSAHWPPTRRLTHSHAHKHVHTHCSEHRVRAELQKPSDKCPCIRLASPGAEAVFLARGCPRHSEEPEGTEKPWAGRRFPGRRVCAFRGFLPQSGPLRQGGHTAAWGSHTRSRMISTPPAQTRDVSKCSAGQVPTTPWRGPLPPWTSRTWGIVAMAPRGRQEGWSRTAAPASLWLCLHGGPAPTSHTWMTGDLRTHLTRPWESTGLCCISAKPWPLQTPAKQP